MSKKKKKNSKFEESSNSSFSSLLNSSLDDSSLHLSFTPITSPIVSKRKQGNLTGIERQIKDSCANIYNATLNWKTLNQKGAKILGEIANAKLKVIFEMQEVEKEKTGTMPIEMEPLCEELLNIIESMKKIVDKLEFFVKKFSNLLKLGEFKLKENLDSVIPFLSWSFKDFERASQKIHEAYATEFLLKENLARNIAHVTDRQLMMFCTRSWVYEPYIEGECRLLLEAMVLETGLK